MPHSVRVRPWAPILVGLVIGAATSMGAQAHPASRFRADALGLRPRSERSTAAVSLALGGSTVGLSLGGQLGYRMGRHELAGQLRYSFKAAVFQGTSRYLLEAGLLYGFHPLASYRVLALRTGVSGIWYAIDPVGPEPKRSTEAVLGLPVELALTAPVGAKFGLGVTAFANLNRQCQYGGVLLTLTFGNP